MNPQCAKGPSELRADEAYRAPTLSAMEALALRYPPIHIWDPIPVLFNTTRYEAFSSGGPLYFDADHVSAYGNHVLFHSFRQAVSSLANGINSPIAP
jgi:hypothetical protein